MITNLKETKFTDEQKKEILEWFAYKVWMYMIDAEVTDGSMKMYDPMDIELKEKMAHSYVFDLEDGGRHHPYKDLEHLENMIFEEGKKAFHDCIYAVVRCPVKESKRKAYANRKED